MRLVNEPNMLERLNMQKAYVDGFYSWQVRSKQWEVYLTSLLSKVNGNDTEQASEGDSIPSKSSKKS